MTEISPIITPSSSSAQLVTRQVTSFAEPLSPSSNLADNIVSASSYASSILENSQVDVVTEEGLLHAAIKLEARHYKQRSFVLQLLETIQVLHIPSWSNPAITPQGLKLQKVSGSLTNAVFFVSYPSLPRILTLLLRIYGPSSGSLISRPRELHTLHVLSSQYRIGPRVYGTFENGRVEEYFESTTLTPSDVRDPKISRWIGARMAELHSVDIEVVEETSPANRGEGKGWELGVKENVKSWLGPAEAVLNLPTLSVSIRSELDLDRFKREWAQYMTLLSKVDDLEGGSKRVFSHNDAQYGNLLRLTKLKEGTAEHRQIIVVDFEYASPNPASFDIANHFHEWTTNYNSSTPHVLHPSLYPTLEERHNFLKAYLEQSCHSSTPFSDLEQKIEKLDQQVQFWSPASHGMWAVWAIVQAREDVEDDVKVPEFDYIGYARCRMEGFRRGIRALGI